jgi:hypothetical protein
MLRAVVYALACTIGVFLFLYIAALGLFQWLAPVQTFDKRAAETRELVALCQHIRDYQAKHGSLPATTDNAELFKILRPDQELAIKTNQEFWGTGSENDNGQISGQIIDQWGTPVRVSLTDPVNPVAHSAGPDKKWDTPDDLFVR